MRRESSGRYRNLRTHAGGGGIDGLFGRGQATEGLRYSVGLRREMAALVVEVPAGIFCTLSGIEFATQTLSESSAAIPNCKGPEATGPVTESVRPVPEEIGEAVMTRFEASANSPGHEE